MTHEHLRHVLDLSLVPALRWMCSVGFVVIAVALLWSPDQLATRERYFRAIRFGEASRSRVMSALEGRAAVERFPSALIASVLAGLALVLAILAAFTRLPIPVLFADLNVSVALLTTTAYASLQSLRVRRFASLQVRDPNR
jgi:hypothetical protein